MKNPQPRRLPLSGTSVPGAIALGVLALSGLLFAACVAWALWSPWPDPPRRPVPWAPDAIVVLGGGDLARAKRAARLAAAFPDTPVIVTGDGGLQERGLRRMGVPPHRILVEPQASSTWENADFSASLLEELGARRVVLVSNWFHIPRSEAVFRKRFPQIEFESAFEPAALPLSPWDRGSQRRERFAALWYWVRHGVNSFESP